MGKLLFVLWTLLYVWSCWDEFAPGPSTMFGSVPVTDWATWTAVMACIAAHEILARVMFRPNMNFDSLGKQLAHLVCMFYLLPQVRDAPRINDVRLCSYRARFLCR